MSLAGPAANALLVLAAALGIRAGVAAGVFAPPAAIGFATLTEATGPGALETLATLLSLLFTLNLLLVVFNLIPLPPLDGGGLLGLVLSPDAARRAAASLARPGFALAGLVAAWLLVDRVFPAVHLVAVNLLYPGVGYR
jgi:Zn-dependent protease